MRSLVRLESMGYIGGVPGFLLVSPVLHLQLEEWANGQGVDGRGQMRGCVRTETTEVNKIVIDSLAQFFSVLGYHNHGLQGIQSLTEPSALFCQGNVLLHGGTDP